MGVVTGVVVDNYFKNIFMLNNYIKQSSKMNLIDGLTIKAIFFNQLKYFMSKIIIAIDWLRFQYRNNMAVWMQLYPNVCLHQGRISTSI